MFFNKKYIKWSNEEVFAHLLFIIISESKLTYLTRFEQFRHSPTAYLNYL